MSRYDVFHLVSREFSKARINHVLIGGFAVNFHQYSRNTGDVDFLMAEKDYEKALPLLEKGGYKEMVRQPLFARLKNEDPGMMDVDIMFVDEPTFEGIFKEGKRAKIEDVEFVVPSLNHLLALKLHSLKHNPRRLAPDLVDLDNLVKINQIDVRSKEFRELCLKFGTSEIYEALLGGQGYGKIKLPGF